MSSFLTLLRPKSPYLSLAFTSASSSTFATYSAVVEGSEGLTVELFLGGVSQGNATETSSGVYELDVTLDSLSNSLVVKVNGVEYASRTVAFSLYGLGTSVVLAHLVTGDNGTDSSGNGYDLTKGTVAGADASDPTYNSDGYFTFDGNDKLFRAYQAELNPSAITITQIVRATGGAGTFRATINSYQGSPRGGYIIYATSANLWQWYTALGDSSALSGLGSRAVSLNSWTRISASVDNSQKTIKINSNGIETQTLTFNPNTTDPLKIGAGGAVDTFFFLGDIAYTVIHNAKLTEAQQDDVYAWLKAHAKANKPTLYASLP